MATHRHSEYGQYSQDGQDGQDGEKGADASPIDVALALVTDEEHIKTLQGVQGETGYAGADGVSPEPEEVAKSLSSSPDFLAPLQLRPKH